MFGPQNMTAVLMVLEIIVGVIIFHRPVVVMKQARGVKGVVLLALRWITL